MVWRRVRERHHDSDWAYKELSGVDPVSWHKSTEPPCCGLMRHEELQGLDLTQLALLKACDGDAPCDGIKHLSHASCSDGPVERCENDQTGQGFQHTWPCTSPCDA